MTETITSKGKNWVVTAESLKQIFRLEHKINEKFFSPADVNELTVHYSVR